MKISINWLKQYIPVTLSAEKLAEALTMSGLEVEEIRAIEPPFRGVVIGRVKDVKKHPNADTLSVCSVDVGDEVLSIICGAPNVKSGQIVPVAKIGARLTGNRVIRKANLRGVSSHGMICSSKELGIGEDHEGILVLDKGEIGEPFTSDALPPDTILDVNITPNRPDCMSHLGVAREVGVITDQSVDRPQVSFPESGPPVEEDLALEILDTRACPRYTARVIRDITVGPSPQWLRDTLESVGVRSINNVVDVTNFVMMETGHPLHAFDYDLVQGKKIIVRKAKDGEEFTTLDHQIRSLEAGDLLIADAERGIALAGVMGGLNSEVSDTTQTVILESAYFDPRTIRSTAHRLGLSSDASQRFERGADPGNTIYSIDRAAQLILENAGGEVDQGCLDVYPEPAKPAQIQLRYERVSHVLGMEIPRDKAISILRKLDLRVTDKDPILVEVPTFRRDLTREIDLIEEIVRHYGFANIEPQKTTTVALEPVTSTEFSFHETLRDILVGAGCFETINSSMVSGNHISIFTPDISPLVIQNPISPDTSHLRTSLMPGLLDTIRHNQNHGNDNLRLFELGRCFHPGAEKLPEEKVLLTVTLTGQFRNRPFWGAEEMENSFFHLKGLLETLKDRLHLPELIYRKAESPVFSADTCQEVFCGKNSLGKIGDLKPDVLHYWDIHNSVYAFEIDIARMRCCLPSRRPYAPFSRFPAVKRDLAVIVDEQVPIADLTAFIRKYGGKHLLTIDLFDIYRGKQIPEHKISVAFSLTFQSAVKTLQDEDVDPVISKMIQILGKEFSAELRS
jgi:phenylalanyl-tRNA synthetase beta chain